MRDAREIAEEIENWMSGGIRLGTEIEAHIAVSITAVRNETLEEAAKICDEWDIPNVDFQYLLETNQDETVGRINAARNLAKSIRALKTREGEKND